MDDLIERANKIARGAGAIQTGQYDSANACERIGRWLNVTSVALGAVVGTSIFASLASPADGGRTIWTVATGLVAVLAAALTAVQATSSYADRAEKHRVAGADYGNVRRRADMLKLKIVGGDVQRAEAIAELEALGNDMTALAKSSYSLADHIYYRAKRKFKTNHGRYWAEKPGDQGPASP